MRIRIRQDGTFEITDPTPALLNIIEKHGTPDVDGSLIFDAPRVRIHVKQRDTDEIYTGVQDYDTVSRIALVIDAHARQGSPRPAKIENVLHDMRYLTPEGQLESIDSEFNSDKWTIDLT